MSLGQDKGSATGTDSHDINPYSSLTIFKTCWLMFIPGHLEKKKIDIIVQAVYIFQH